MPEFYGSLQHVTIAGSLWAILFFPFAAAVFCAVYPFWLAKNDPKLLQAERDRRIALVSIGAASLAFAASVFHAAVLARAPEDERFLLQHLWRMVRFGQLDASF